MPPCLLPIVRRLLLPNVRRLLLPNVRRLLLPIDRLPWNIGAASWSNGWSSWRSSAWVMASIVGQDLFHRKFSSFLEPLGRPRN
jgi:hypothetical protein